MTSKEEKIMEGIKVQYEWYLKQYYDALAKDDYSSAGLFGHCIYAFERALILSKHIAFYNRLVKLKCEWDDRYYLWHGKGTNK